MAAPISLLEFIQRSQKKVWLQVSSRLSSTTVIILNRMLEDDRTREMANHLIGQYQKATQFHYTAIFVLKLLVSSQNWKVLNYIKIPSVPTEEMLENYVAYFNPISSLPQQPPRYQKPLNPAMVFLIEIVKCYFNDDGTFSNKQELDEKTKLQLEREIDDIIPSLIEPSISIPGVREHFLQNVIRDQFPDAADKLLNNLTKPPPDTDRELLVENEKSHPVHIINKRRRISLNNKSLKEDLQLEVSNREPLDDEKQNGPIREDPIHIINKRPPSSPMNDLPEILEPINDNSTVSITE